MSFVDDAHTHTPRLGQWLTTEADLRSVQTRESLKLNTVAMPYPLEALLAFAAL